MKLKIGILYICTGKYKIFWRNFFESTQKYLLTQENFDKQYFVFTDAEQIEYESNTNVHKIYQEQLAWPYITLNRFEIFQKALPQLKTMDFIYFFNANMLMVDYVGEEILPTKEKLFSFLLHPGMVYKKREEFPYENNVRSLAYISEDQGTYYYMGSLNGGIAKYYLAMIKELSLRIDDDLTNGIVAVWHDESHLNKFALENQDLIKNLPIEYGTPQGSIKTTHPKIIILDKGKFGGHAYLRGNKNKYYYKLGWLCTKVKQKMINGFKTIKIRMTTN